MIDAKPRVYARRPSQKTKEKVKFLIQRPKVQRFDNCACPEPTCQRNWEPLPDSPERGNLNCLCSLKASLPHNRPHSVASQFFSHVCFQTSARLAISRCFSRSICPFHERAGPGKDGDQLASHGQRDLNYARQTGDNDRAAPELADLYFGQSNGFPDVSSAFGRPIGHAADFRFQGRARRNARDETR